MAGEKTVNDITFRIRHTMMRVCDLDRSLRVALVQRRSGQRR